MPKPSSMKSGAEPHAACGRGRGGHVISCDDRGGATFGAGSGGGHGCLVTLRSRVPVTLEYGLPGSGRLSGERSTVGRPSAT